MADEPLPPVTTFEPFVTLAELKKHLNIETAFTEDDTYITSLIEVAQISVKNYCCGGIDSYTIDNVPIVIKQAIMLLGAHLYTTRTVVSFAQGYEIPYSFKFLLNPYVIFTVA